jgi:uncharacterized protein (TIGR03663 family)
MRLGSRVDQIIRKHHYWIFIFLILTAIFLRFYNLPLRVLHHDEAGGHDFFTMVLCENHEYTYDPQFHGPFLYHATCLSYFIFGRNVFALRFMPALFGVLLLPYIYWLRRALGTYGYLAASALLAVSPSFVYYSRFLLHDMFYLFFIINMWYGIYRFRETKKIRYWVLTWAAAAAMFTVKESAFIVGFVMITYFVLDYLYSLYKAYPVQQILPVALRKFPDDVKRHLFLILTAALSFSVVFTTIYSSGFRFPGNIWRGIVLPLQQWGTVATSVTGHAKPYTYYFLIFQRYELAIFILGILGLIMATKSNNKFWQMIVYYAILNDLAYFIMSYKTPWLITHLLLPLILLAGYFVEQVYHLVQENYQRYTLFFTTLLMIFFVSLGLSVEANFYSYDNDQNILTYVQATREVKTFLEKYDHYARSLGKQPLTLFLPEDYWTQKWYLRNFESIQYFTYPAGRFPGCYYPDAEGCIPLRYYDVVVIRQEDSTVIENYMNMSDYDTLVYLQRNKMYHKAYFRLSSLRNATRNLSSERLNATGIEYT